MLGRGGGGAGGKGGALTSSMLISKGPWDWHSGQEPGFTSWFWDWKKGPSTKLHLLQSYLTMASWGSTPVQLLTTPLVRISWFRCSCLGTPGTPPAKTRTTTTTRTVTGGGGTYRSERISSTSGRLEMRTWISWAMRPYLGYMASTTSLAASSKIWTQRREGCGGVGGRGGRGGG